MTQTPRVPSRSTVLTLAALSAFGPISTDVILPALPIVTAEFLVGQSQGQGAITATFIGTSVGQAFAGPWSDRVGRRLPAIVSAAGFGLTGVAAAFAPNMSVLLMLSFVLGATGAIGIVSGRAAVSDIAKGTEAVRLFSLLSLINGLAPVLAPLLGAAVLAAFNWRSIYWTLGIIGLVLVIIAVTGFPETLPLDHRQNRTVRDTIRIWKRLMTNRRYAGYVLTMSCTGGTLFTYLSSSPFVVEDGFHYSSSFFSVVFAVDAAVIVAFASTNRWLVKRFDPHHILVLGVSSAVTGGLLTILGGLTHVFALVWLGFALGAGSIGFTFPNSTALGLDMLESDKGSGAALFGILGFAIGATVAPVAGLFGKGNPVGTGGVMTFMGLCAAFFAINAMRNRH